MEPFFRLGADNVLTAGNHRAQLTPTEARAMAHFLEHPGTVVSRKTLEVEVWGFNPGVRSEAVPVALRVLRGKLGPHGERLQTLRGVGWRLMAVPDRPSFPAFGTPFFPRDDVLNSLGSLFESGWRIVSLVGPGGAGKTRAAVEYAQSFAPNAVWIHVGEARSQEEVVLAIQGALGTIGGGLAELATVLEKGTHPLLILDEAEACSEPIGEVVSQLPGLFLITTRRELKIEGEASFSLEGLRGPEALAFLDDRLQASRWSTPTSVEEREAAVQALDGLPLALEFAAVHPFGLADLVTSLDQKRFPESADGTPWMSALKRSFDDLPLELVQVLLRLCACDCVLPEDELARWLGPEARSLARQLATRSLLSQEGRGWRVLRTVRVYLTSHPDLSAAQDHFDAWLVSRCAELGNAFLVDPGQAICAWEVLAPPMTRALDRIPLEEVEPMAIQLCEFYSCTGPMKARAQVLVASRKRHPTSLTLRLLAAPHTGDEAAILEAERSQSPALRAVALQARTKLLPATLDATFMSMLAPDLYDIQRLQVQTKHLSVAIMRQPLDEALALLEQLAGTVEAARAFPLLQMEGMLSLGGAYHHCRLDAHAVAILDDCIALCAESGARVTELLARRIREIARIRLPQGRNSAGMHAIANDLASTGLEMQSRDCLGYAALVEISGGDLDAAARSLHKAGGSPSMVAMCAVMRLALESMDGDAGARNRLEGTTAEFLTKAGEHKRFAQFFIAYLQGLATLGPQASPRERKDQLQGMLDDSRLAIDGYSSPDCVMLSEGMERQLDAV